MPSPTGDAPKQKEGWMQWLARKVGIKVPILWSKAITLSSRTEEQLESDEPQRKRQKENEDIAVEKNEDSPEEMMIIETVDTQQSPNDHSLRDIVSSSSATNSASTKRASRRPVTTPASNTDVNLARKKIVRSKSYANKKYRLAIVDGMKKEKELRENSRVQKILKEEEEGDSMSENGSVRSGAKESRVEFIIAQAKGQSLNDNLPSEVLVKYSTDSRAVWVKSTSLNDELTKAFRVRTQWEDELATFLISQSKDSHEFESLYGGRFLKKAQSDRAWQMMLERAREEDINEMLTRVNLAPIFIVDWSPNLYDQKEILKNSLFEFEYTSFLNPSRRVRKQLHKGHYIMNDDKYKCFSECGCGDRKDKELCKCSKKDAGWSQSEVECWDDCSCSETCPNRVVQRGRQMPLIMMRHHIKGWTMRAFRDIKKGEFIAEYSGEVLTYAEHLELDNNTYSVDLPCCFVDRNKKSNSRMKEKTRVREPWMEGYVHRRFIITAKRMGNEGRTFSHSCEPNMEMRMTYIERHGYGYHHIAFYANEDIERFSELTWNYFGEALVEKQRKKLTFSSSILPKCSCGSKKCVIVPWNGTEDKKEENREDSCSDFSDNDDDDVKLVGRM